MWCQAEGCFTRLYPGAWTSRSTYRELESPAFVTWKGGGRTLDKIRCEKHKADLKGLGPTNRCLEPGCSRMSCRANEIIGYEWCCTTGICCVCNENKFLKDWKECECHDDA